MKDMYGKEVVNGDLMSEGHGDHCYIFKVVDNKPMLMAFWGFEVLEKFTTDNIKENDRKVEEGIKNSETPDFLKNYFKQMLKRIQEMKTESLMKVDGVELEVIKRFIDKGHESIEFKSNLSTETYLTTMTAYFPEGEMIRVK